MLPLSRTDGRVLRQQARALSAWLDGWDPLGVYALDDPPEPGELDDLVWPLLRLLRDGADRARLTAHLEEALTDLGVEGDAPADALLAWWAAVGSGPEQALAPEAAAALVERALLPVEDTPLLAAHWLAEGRDGPALRALAGLTRRDPDVSAQWDAVRDELGVRADSRAALTWLARQVASGTGDPGWLVSAFSPYEDDDPDPVLVALDDLLETAARREEDGPPAPRWWRRARAQQPPEELRALAACVVLALADEDLAEAHRLLDL